MMETVKLELLLGKSEKAPQQELVSQMLDFNYDK